MNATAFGSACVQSAFFGLPPTVPGAEDCLFMNIYVPGSVIDVSQLLPVKVWIHVSTVLPLLLQLIFILLLLFFVCFYEWHKFDKV